VHDSEYAEEFFDAALQSLYNHRKQFREHQTHLQLLSSTIGASQRRERLKTMDQSTFEKQVEEQELKKLQFDIKPYRKRRVPAMVQVKKPAGRRDSASLQAKPTYELPMPKSKSAFVGRKKEAVDISEIDIEDIEDEYLQLFIDENFRPTEWFMTTMPFQHWSLYKTNVPQSVRGGQRNQHLGL
jgi:hypothetical protein